jgi:hypothetical protein
MANRSPDALGLKSMEQHLLAKQPDRMGFGVWLAGFFAALRLSQNQRLCENPGGQPVFACLFV